MNTDMVDKLAQDTPGTVSKLTSLRYKEGLVTQRVYWSPFCVLLTLVKRAPLQVSF